MNRNVAAMVGEEEFLQYWIHKGGFELVDGELVPMPEWFSDDCLPSGSTFVAVFRSAEFQEQFPRE